MKAFRHLRSNSKHIDSHLKPFRCRKPGCANQAFSSVACRLRHEREMHKMHNAEEFLCRYDGPCERKQPGNGFARSFNRGDHEKRVHHIFQENTRSKGRPKGASSETSNAYSALRKLSRWDNNSTSDESSTSTIADTVEGLPGDTNFASPPNTTLSIMQNQAQVIPSFPGIKRNRFSKTGTKSNTRGSCQVPKRSHEQWTEHVDKRRNLELDPELALALRMAYEEEKARQEKERKAKEEAEKKKKLEGIPEPGATVGEPVTQVGGQILGSNAAADILRQLALGAEAAAGLLTAVDEASAPREFEYDTDEMEE